MVFRRTATEPYTSWAADRLAAAGDRQPRMRRYRDRISVLDILIALATVAMFDMVATLCVSGWQSARCGDLCGLRTQLHLMHIAAVLTLFFIVVPPVLVAVLTRHGRMVIVVAQVVLCVGLAVNTLGAQHRLTSRLNGTAICWNPGYSNADCPWGPKD